MSIFVDMDAPNTTDVIQAVCALATLSLALYGIIINRKVETLTETNSRLAETVTQLENQTKELAKQTDIISSSYQLQMQITPKDRTALFQLKDHKLQSYSDYVYFEIMNTGQPGLNVHVASVRRGSEVTNVINAEMEQVLTNYYRIKVRLRNENEPFEILLRWRNDGGLEYHQVIYCYNYQISLGAIEFY